MAKFTTVLITVLFVSCKGPVFEPSPRIASYSDIYSDNVDPQLEQLPGDSIREYTVKYLEYVNIHCTASKGELTKEWLLNFFKYERGWSKPGYNLVVHMDGSVDTLVPYDLDGVVQYDEISYGVKGKNEKSINVAYTGGVDKWLKPKDTRTKAQKDALRYVVNTLTCQFGPGIKVMGHNNHLGVSKACPSFDAFEEYTKTLVGRSELFDNASDTVSK